MWTTPQRTFSRVFVLGLLLGILLLGSGIFAQLWAVGGTNGLLERMEKMSSEMAESKELSEKERIEYQEKVKVLRQKIDERIQQTGGLNPVKDKDLYDEINAANKPLFDAYQKSKAKPQNDPRQNINRFLGD